MASSIDTAVEILNILNKPTRYCVPQIVAFQRDNQLHLIGREAVAVIDYGVPCSPYSGHYDKTLGRHIDNPARDKSSTIGEDGKIIESERKYFAPLCFGSDSRTTTFEELLKLREIEEDLKDDGRIRMVDYGISYHSHKFGYAMDGEDVYVNGARVMDREEYFDLMRMGELHKREELDIENGSGYITSSLPGIAILTPYALISFPLPSRLNVDDRDAWETWKSNGYLRGNIFEFRKQFSPRDESPYAFNVTLNKVNFSSSSEDNFSKDYNEVLMRLNNLKDCYTSAVQTIVTEANSAHNLKHAKKIEEHKKFIQERKSRSI